ncbi:hypothetical protein [Desulfurivibrio alkaliphilus]|uniref:hypothetical protein n=1 Tax=Desulfurivibrio alkaliphilus TaxID=427923 RepID=UPI00032205C6|nr:hypothetical protein [Desulfurivibrio alkaliphilus]
MVIASYCNQILSCLFYRTAGPLASRVVTRYHFQNVDQGAGGLFRKANHLARGTLEKTRRSTPSNARLATSELL